jgi:hypothetical protein
MVPGEYEAERKHGLCADLDAEPVPHGTGEPCRAIREQVGMTSSPQGGP